MTLLNPVAPMLDVRDLRVRRGGVEVVHGVSVRVFSGTIATIVGPNGGGKSSTLLAIARLLRPIGEVRFEGRRMDRMSSPRVVRWGLVHAGQARGLIGRLTVRENLLLGAWTRRDRYALDREIDAVCDRFPDLGRSRDRRAWDLDAAEQQFLALGRALMAKPKLLLLDEPSAGLPPERVAEFFALVQRLNADGITILLAEQYERKAVAISDYIYVMKRGRIVKDGVARQMLHDPEIEHAHVGAGE
jgi:branched-chain amino acid transport system ATP-binding protein